MNNNLASVGGILAAAFVVLLSQSLFIVNQVQQALVVELGQPQRVITDPGLNFKIPFVQEVITFDKRLLDFDDDPQEVLSSDKKNLRVDNYARWRIVDPLKFYRTVRNEAGALSRLNDIIYSNLREVLGQFTMMEIVAGARTDLMVRIKDQVNEQADKYGIVVDDVRIKRTDLPPENSKAVFRRMQTERERQAKQYRAEGEEEAVKIRAKADRDREVLLAKSYETAQKLRGEGEGEAARIYAEAFNMDPNFYGFVRSMEAYTKAFKQDSTMIMEPDSEFFRYFKGTDASVNGR